ncbi:hypothetical protein [Halodesulfovibrio marinisediminis]|nr:hypothetical protein [Halodesulfovibrio marinisediminis]
MKRTRKAGARRRGHCGSYKAMRACLRGIVGADISTDDPKKDIISMRYA